MVLVVLYHAKFPGFTGGYVGVDVFFVLSGFLITGLLYRELRSTHRISLPNFYARRARRLLPAAGLVLLATLAASLWLLPAFSLPGVTTDISSAALYASNMRFGFQANDYFQTTTAASPVLHYWSLSVEEQFYILWPAVLILAHNWLPKVGSVRARVAGTIGAIGAVSLLGAIWLTNVNQPWAFFLLPTRAWELALGGLLAVLARRLVVIPRRLAGAASGAGVGLVIVSAMLLDDNTAFPGFAAILPVAGSALVILGGFSQPATLPSRVLGLGPFRFLGRISYSLYLWHWPILVFGAALLGASWVPLLVLAAIPVAAASQRWVEEPVRHGRFIGTLPSRNLLQAAGVGLVVVAAAFAVSPPAAPEPVAAAGGRTERNAEASPRVSSPQPAASGSEAPAPQSSAEAASSAPTLAPDNPPVPCNDCTISDLTPSLNKPLAGRSPGCLIDQVSDPAKCVLGYAVGSSATVAVFGDSHAQSWGPTLELLASTRGWRVLDMTHGGCPSVTLTVWASDLKRANTECDVWREAAFARLAAERPTVILISNARYSLMRGGNRIDPESPPSAWGDEWSQGLDKTLSTLAPLDSLVVVVGDMPALLNGGIDPLVCLAQHPNAFQAMCKAPRASATPAGIHDLEKATTASRGVLFVDPTSWLCDADSCPAVIARYLVYTDGYGHITGPFARSLAGRLLAAAPFPP